MSAILKFRIIGYILAGIGLTAGMVAASAPRSEVFGIFSPDGIISPTGTRLIRFLGICLVTVSLAMFAVIWKQRRFIAGARVIAGKIAGLPDWEWLISVCLSALLLRTAWIISCPGLPVSDFEEYYNWGRQLSRGETYSYRTGLGYGDTLAPTAYKPPGFPIFLAGVFKIFGPGLLTAQFSQAFLGALTCVLLFFLVKEAAPAIVAKLASLILAFYPAYIFASSLIAAEHLFVVTLLLSILFFLKGMRQCSCFWMTSAGICIGLSALVKSQVMLLPVGLAAVETFSGEGSISRRFRAAFLFIVAFYVTTIPWQVRNYRLFHRWGIMSLNGGVTFFHSNTPRGIEQIPPLKTKLLQEGYNEYEMDRLFFRKGWESIRRQPLWVLKNIVNFKFRRFFSFVDLEWLAQYNFKKTYREVKYRDFVSRVVVMIAALGYTVVFIFAIYGFLKSRLLAPFHLVCITIFLYWLLTVAIFHGNPRYRYPLVPFYAYFAGWGIYVLRKILK